MKGIYVIAIAFLASWTIITASKLPIIFETEDECPMLDIFPLKIISHKTDCTKYYECKNNQKQLRSCEVGLYFSKRWSGCVRQDISDCPQDDSDECPNPDSCPPKLIPIEVDCTKYYECKDSKKVLRSCKSGLYFSQYWHGCVSWEISDCPLTTPTSTSTTPTSTPILPECPNPDTCPPKLISHKTDCTKYYECKHSKKELRTCTTGLYFSQYWHGCVSREISDCPLDDSDDQCPNPDTCPPKLISHETDCSKYYECKNSKKEPHSCMAGLYFSQYWHGCVSREISDCPLTTPTSTSTTPTPTSTTPTPTSTTPTPTSITPTPTSTTPTPTSTTPIPISTTPTPTTPILPECPNPDTCPPKLISHETDCSKYYECKNSKKEPHSCMAGLYFSQYWHGCVSREISDCPLTTPTSTSTTPTPTSTTPTPTSTTPTPTSTTPTPTSTTPTPTTPILPKCPNLDTCPPKLISHETDCSKYYECKNSKKEPRSCMAGLYFSQYWHGCVDREISDCPFPTTILPECPNPDTCPPKLISHEMDCSKYYECKNSKKEPRSCMAGLYFSQYWHGCVDLESSDCPLPITTSISTDPTPTIPSPQCINGDLQKHECTCTKYYLCIKGYKVSLECPAGKHFDISTKTCQPGTGCLQVTPSPTSISITSRCTEGEYMPHECECNKYYECKVGRKALRECNDGMIFDKALQTCVLGQC